MTHSRRKELARLRTRYTGESYQQAADALRRTDVPLPSADSADQWNLESAVMVALASSGGSVPEGWLPKKRYWPDGLALTIKTVRPMRDGLELHIAPGLLGAFLDCLSFTDGRRPAEGSFELCDWDGHGRVVVRGLPRRGGPGKRKVYRCLGASNAGRPVPGGMSMNPRWARNSFEIEGPQRSLAGSELLRRAGLFTEPGAGRWITTWAEIYLLGPRYEVDWLPDPVPPSLAKALADPVFGIRIPKPADLPLDVTNNQRTRDPRFLAGPELERFASAPAR